MKFKYEDIITTDEYDEEFFQKISDLFIDEDKTSKCKTAVKALHKYELHQVLNDKESAIIELLNSHIRLNIYEFFENEYYDDAELFKNLGVAALGLNEYGCEDMQNELLVLISINLEDFSNLDKKTLNKLKREVKKITDNLAKSHEEVNMINVLRVFKQYLDALKVKLADDIVDQYAIYKGWKMIALLRKEESFYRRKALLNRKVDFNTNHKIARLKSSDNDIDKLIFYDSLLEDLKKYEQFIVQSYVNKTFSNYEDLTLSYYKIVLTTMSLKDNVQVIDKYKSLIKNGYFNSDNEELLREAVSYVDKNRVNLKLMTLNKIVKTLHITKARAEAYDLEMLYFYTLTQGTKSRVKFTDKLETLSEHKERLKNEAISKGQEVKKYRDKGLNYQEISKKIHLSRAKVSEKYKSYILNEYEINKDNLKTDEELNEFAKAMHETRKKIDKLIGDN
ncbi:hypothetical protein [Companilactobacillus insicii]|uniref:hypothetical protein n=1 Tax=Companilactobacillus insicii TaxID=1732567 RepID=UPI000F7A4FC3|nr:hypothetical protein [Companilactobacillus insicii]